MRHWSALRRFVRACTFAALLVAAIGIAVVAVPLTRFPAPRPSAIPAAEVAVVQRLVDLAQRAEVTLEWAPAFDIRGGASGLVTSVSVTAGELLECGDIIAMVDDQPVVAFCAPQPLWRDLSGSSRGSDAESLREFLVTLSLLESVGAPDDDVAVALDDLRARLGLAEDAPIGPRLLSWVGTGPVTIGVVEAQIGRSLAPGDVVASTHVELVSARLQSGSPDVDLSEFSLSLSGLDEPLSITSDGHVVGADELSAEIAELVSGPEGPGDVIDGQIRLREPIEAWAVPATALIADGSLTCVRVTGEPTSTSAVEVIDYSAGTAMVLGDLAAGSSVLADPGGGQCS